MGVQRLHDCHAGWELGGGRVLQSLVALLIGEGEVVAGLDRTEPCLGL